MFFSVIVPTCNRNNLLINCLDKLSPLNQTIRNVNYEVIITDDSFNDSARILIEGQYSWAKWIEGPRKGPAANRNNGTKYSTGDWLVFIDDDCIPENNILEEYEKAIYHNPEIVAFEGRIFTGTPQTSFLQESPINNTGGYFWSCNFCIAKDTFHSLGGFDENFPYATMEDVDLYYRLKLTTNKYMFVYQAAVIHPWRINKNHFKTLLKRYESQMYFQFKHQELQGKDSAHFYFMAFIKLFQFTIKNAWKFRFSGIITKLGLDFFQLYFAFRSILKLDRKYKIK